MNETLGPDQIPEGWSRVAGAYENSFEPLSRQYAADLFRRLDLRAGLSVIDVAAGTGVFSLIAARAGIEVLAVDFAPGMVERLRRRAASDELHQLRAEIMDGQALAVPDARFDAGVSILGLIFFPDIGRGLAELRRVVRPGGKIGIVCWADARNLKLMTYLVRAIQKVVPGFQLPADPPSWARLAGADALRERMGEAGIRDIAVVESVGIMRVESPESFWSDFTRSAPPVAYLFERLGPEVTAAVGRAYVEQMEAEGGNGPPSAEIEACIGIGTA